MFKSPLIWCLTLIIFLGYLVLFISTVIAYLIVRANKALSDGITKLQWVRSNLRIKLWKDRRH